MLLRRERIEEDVRPCYDALTLFFTQQGTHLLSETQHTDWMLRRHSFISYCWTFNFVGRKWAAYSVTDLKQRMRKEGTDRRGRVCVSMDKHSERHHTKKSLSFI